MSTTVALLVASRDQLDDAIEDAKSNSAPTVYIPKEPMSEREAKKWADGRVSRIRVNAEGKVSNIEHWPALHRFAVLRRRMSQYIADAARDE